MLADLVRRGQIAGYRPRLALLSSTVANARTFISSRNFSIQPSTFDAAVDSQATHLPPQFVDNMLQALTAPSTPHVSNWQEA
jgi:hypothetical protein